MTIEIETLTFKVLADRYCKKVNPDAHQLLNWKKKWGPKPAPEDLVTPEKLHARLHQQKIDYQPIGWMLLECHMMDSSSMGQWTILPFGPNNTFKQPPDHPISPRGLASDMSVVIAVLPASEIQ